jgi:hypothetical protein
VVFPDQGYDGTMATRLPSLVVLAGCRFSADHVPDASPDAPVVQANIAFVTSMTITPGTLGGLAQADALCGQLARDAGMEGQYVAWLSDNNTSAKDRLGAARGWVRPDGLPFADTLTDLLAGHIFYPLRIDERGTDRGNDTASVVTATDGAGKSIAENCSNFTQPGGGALALAGLADAGVSTWTNGTEIPCTEPARLYCFGIDRAQQVSVAPANGKRAFVTSNAYAVAAMGIPSADAACTNEASTVGLGGTFAAFIATTTQSAVSRFSNPGAVWFRLDDVQLDMSGSGRAPLDLTASRQYQAMRVWTGAMSPTAVGTIDSTCGDWMSSSATGEVGDSSRSAAVGFALGKSVCSTTSALYCLEK